MATFKAEIQNKRSDGTYNVRIRVTHNRVIRRLSTNIYVTGDDLTRNLKIKNQSVLDQCEPLLKKCRDYCNTLGFEINNMSIDDLVDKLKSHLEGGDVFHLDFIKYTKQKAASMNPGTASTYTIMLSALQRFIKRDHLDITEITTAFLRDFEKFIEANPASKVVTAKRKRKILSPKAAALYLHTWRVFGLSTIRQKPNLTTKTAD